MEFMRPRFRNRVHFFSLGLWMVMFNAPFAVSRKRMFCSGRKQGAVYCEEALGLARKHLKASFDGVVAMRGASGPWLRGSKHPPKDVSVSCLGPLHD